MTPERFALLTRRHRECLRGVKALKGSKEIAAELGLGKSTVDIYLAEAVRLLGARNRREAALAPPNMKSMKPRKSLMKMTKSLKL